MPELTIIEVDAFTIPELLVPRIVKVYHRSPEDALNMVREAKRMLYLSIVSEQPVAPSDIVDEAWHEMLMFTRFYKSFAEFIGGFIHHDPTDPEMSANDSSVAVEARVSGETPVYTRTKLNYEKFFGEKPDSRYWP